MSRKWQRRRRRGAEEKSPAQKPVHRRGGDDRDRGDAGDRHGAFYKAGPVVRLKEAGRGAVAVAEQEEKRPAGPVPTARGSAPPQHEEAHATSVRLEGRTDADYDGGSYHTEGVTVARAEGCEGCSGDNCLRVSGTLVATYSVSTRVTLPSADDFPELTACQRRRVQTAIDTVLAPHEQEHVRAFHRYDGTTRTPFDLTLCRSEFDGRIQAMFEAEESARRATAQAASDALDPFHFDVDIDCEEPTASAEETMAKEGTAAPPPGEVAE